MNRNEHTQQSADLQGRTAPLASESIGREEIIHKLEGMGVTRDDISFFAECGKDLSDVYKELFALTTSHEFVKVASAATIENGFIRHIGRNDAERLLEVFKTRAADHSPVMIVPTAGAASRQFQLLKTICNHESFDGLTSYVDILEKAQRESKELEQGKTLSDAERALLKGLREVTEDLPRLWNNGVLEKQFAFYDDLEAVFDSKLGKLSEVVASGNVRKVAEVILDQERGLGYAQLPKALMRYHSYPQEGGSRENRLALEDHLRAGAQIFEGLPSLRMHFILSQEHEPLFERALSEIKAQPGFQDHLQRHGFSLGSMEVDWSFQAHSTDSVALDIASGEIARDESGQPLLRKAGHGALLPNLSDIDAGGMWVQNVDNILYDNPAIRSGVVLYKRLLAGAAIALEEEAGEHQKRLQKSLLDGVCDENLNRAAQRFINEDLQMELPSSTLGLDPSKPEAAEFLMRILKRPVVASGYVPLEPGQAGGGPFVLEQELSPNGPTVRKVSTVEGAEIEGGQSNPIFHSGNFFNPVNLFIARRQTDGSLYDLNEFADPSRCFLSEKPDAKGRLMRTYERPGAWNGGLALAAQVSLATPAQTFSALKTCAGKESFLSPLHQPMPDAELITPLDRERKVVDGDLEEFLKEKGC